MIHQIIYYSRGNENSNNLTTLRDILSTARTKNANNKVTGFLIFDNNWFVQVLEGARENVEETYRRISNDRRHSSVTLMSAKVAPERLFANWSMGGGKRSVEAHEIYLGHGIDKAIEPAKMKSETILSLARSLSSFELRRKLI